MKILVADDDAVSRSVMRRMLVQSGYEVTLAGDGNEAVHHLTEEDGPRLVLLDWMMPGLDGPAVCRAVRSSKRVAYIYITLLTSRDSKEDLVLGLEAGADDYLTKPCNNGELKARLRTGERILQLEDILVRAREDMRFKATHDALTLLLDRGAILNDLATEIETALNSRREFSLVLCDVDRFKLINDTYGHPVGDEVLREVARRLRASVREDDRVGRYGGEEFLLVLDNCCGNMLAARAERVCRSISARPVNTSVGAINVTISAGAMNIGQHDTSYNVDLLLQKVDAALYRAKEQGRNRFVLTTLSPQPVLVAAS